MLASIVMRLSATAPAMAPAVMASIAAREPTRENASPPPMAPTTPPRLNAVMPLLATAGVNPAPVNTDGSQLKPR